MALDPLVSDDAQEAEVAPAGRPRRVVAVDRRGNALPTEQGEGDVADLHGRLRNPDFALLSRDAAGVATDQTAADRGSVDPRWGGRSRRHSPGRLRSIWICRRGG